MTEHEPSLFSIFADDISLIGSVELQPDGSWRASTKRELVGSFKTRDEAVAAVHAVHDCGGAS